MDQRQSKIVEGAGLEESRLNTEFIDFLRKWSSPVLFALAAVAASYAGWQWWQRAQAQAFDQAHVELEAAMNAGSPDSLLAVASDHAGQGQVAIRATLAAADIYLSSGRAGIVPGGDPSAEEDQADAETVGVYFTRSKELYGEAIGMSRGKQDAALHELRARFGLAAAMASLDDIEGAERELEAVKAAAERTGFPGLIAEADKRIAELNRYATLAALPTEDEVKASARPEASRVQTPSSELDFSNDAPAGPIGPMPPPGSPDSDGN